VSAIGHYLEAELMARLAVDEDECGHPDEAALSLKFAAVHASLAAAGLQALQRATPEGMPAEDRKAWLKATSVKHDPAPVLKEAKAA
jgi:hypothetical protein